MKYMGDDKCSKQWMKLQVTMKMFEIDADKETETVESMVGGKCVERKL